MQQFSFHNNYHTVAHQTAAASTACLLLLAASGALRIVLDTQRYAPVRRGIRSCLWKTGESNVA